MNADEPLIRPTPAEPGAPDAARPLAGPGADADVNAPAGDDFFAPDPTETVDTDTDALNTDAQQPSVGIAAEPSSRAGEPVAAVPPEMAAPDVTPAAGNAPAKGHTWDPEAVPAISAAKAAADFVAQIFADVSAPEAAPVEHSVDVEDVDAPGASGAEAEPQVAPREAMAQLLQGQNILILGLGASGLAMARWCVRCGAEVTVADTRAAPPQLPLLQQELPQVRFVAGAFDASLVEGQGLNAVYRSPGLSPEAIAPVLIAASACGISAGATFYSNYCRGADKAHRLQPGAIACTMSAAAGGLLPRCSFFPWALPAPQVAPAFGVCTACNTSHWVRAICA